jgi:hypothetical protein
MKTGRSIQLLAAGTAGLAMALATGASSAAVFPSKLLSASVTIIDQQSPLQYGNGNPIVDPDTGLPETYDDTSVNIDALFLGNILTPIASPTTAPTTDVAPLVSNLLTILIEPAGYCAQLASKGLTDVTFERLARGFQIPLSSLVKVPGLLPGYEFEGLTEDTLGLFQVPAAAEKIAPASLTNGATFESEGPNLFDGDPWANLDITTSLVGGEVKLDGITDLSPLLGTPKLSVDLLIGVRALGGLGAMVSAPAASIPPCITVPATLVVRPVAPSSPYSN